MGILIDGKLLSNKLKDDIRNETQQLKNNNIVPGLAVIIVGSNPSSEIYVKNKINACNNVGIYSELIRFNENVQETEIIAKIKELNNRCDINGILVQLPLPQHINVNSVIMSIDPSKDVDCFTNVNVGKLVVGEQTLYPCTPCGIMYMLKEYNIELQGKNCVVIGRSNIVGKPMTLLLINAGATVTCCNSKTKNLKEITKNADIVICAIGKPKYITADYIKEGSVVIDVGINRLDDGKICGDIDFDDVKNIASYITPVPGGVGPMTVASLLKNTIVACKEQYLLNKGLN